MTGAAESRVQLADLEGGGRTTMALLASLSARLSVLHAASGATAVASMVAGFAALGRAVGRTAEGARLREALERGRAGTNGAMVWDALRLGEWAASAPPAPVLDHLRNDVALLLAPDLDAAIVLAPGPAQAAGSPSIPDDDAPATFLDCLLGLYASSRELVQLVDAIAAPTLATAPVVWPPDTAEPVDGPLLR